MNLRILYIIFFVLSLACNQEENRQETISEYTKIEASNNNQIYEKTWDQFRFGLIENSRDFDWTNHGIENADMFYDIAEDLDSDYVKEILAETTYDILDNATFEGKNTKVLHLVTASSEMVMGYSYHFIISGFSQVELVGKTTFVE